MRELRVNFEITFGDNFESFVVIFKGGGGCAG